MAPDAPVPWPTGKPLMFTVGGLGASRGFAAGHVYLYRGEGDFVVPEYVVEPDRVMDELRRYHEARKATRAELESLRAELQGRDGDAAAQLMENHLAMLDDPVVVSAVEQLIRGERLNVAFAVRRAMGKYRDIFAGMDDPYLKERVRDLDDLERRFLRVLLGRADTGLADIHSPVILVADDLTPSETISLPREYVLGFATGGGSVTSHVALLARSLGIPAVTGLGDITARVAAGDFVLLDGTNGSLTVNPDASTVRDFERFAGRERELFRIVDECRGLPCVTTDGHETSLRANASPGMPVAGALGFGADGIGLYRSEYLWLSRSTEPSEEEQFQAYSEAVRGAGGRPVTIRALDLGGDKLVGGMDVGEDNPFLGNRSIRYLLSHRETFRAQLRAILRASAFGKVQVMYPLVATVEELKAANAELAGEMGRLRLAGVPFDPSIRHGVMIEVPSAALNAAEFAREADFFSIGTNDLVQYTLAADRGNDAVAYLYQPTNPAVLRLVKMTVDAANAAGIPVAVCGESASDPVLAMLWVGMGVTELSMSASYIPAIKKTLRSVSFADIRSLADEVVAAGGPTAAAVYTRCREFLLAKVPELAEVLTLFMHDGLTV